MATLRSLIYLIASGFTDGRDQKAGSKSEFQSLTLTNGEHYQTGSVVADDYGESQLWASGQGGLDTFDVAVIESNRDILVLLSDGAVDSVVTVKAGVRSVIGGQVDAALAGDGNPDTPGDVDEIIVKRNVADGGGDAYVTITLYG